MRRQMSPPSVAQPPPRGHCICIDRLNAEHTLHFSVLSSSGERTGLNVREVHSRSFQSQEVPRSPAHVPIAGSNPTRAATSTALVTAVDHHFRPCYAGVLPGTKLIVSGPCDLLGQASDPHGGHVPIEI